MKNKLFLSVLLISLLSLGYSQNHKMVNQNDCRKCHVCANPTTENPCLIQCSRHNGVTDKSKQNVPSVVILKEIAQLYLPVPFAHQLHATMAELSGGCALCHHNEPNGQSVQPCKNCHVSGTSLQLNKPGLKGAYHRQCLSCHRAWDQEGSCSICHEIAKGKSDQEKKVTILDVPHPKIVAELSYTYTTSYKPNPIVTFHHRDHSDHFGLTCANCHQGESCNNCHEIGHKRNKIEHTISCTNCHSEDNCNFCHDDKKSAETFNHKINTGWEIKSYHQQLRCELCHGKAKNFVKPDSDCKSCHIKWLEKGFDHNVVGFILDENHAESDCENCHKDLNYTMKPDCSICHDDISFPEYLPGKLLEQRKQ